MVDLLLLVTDQSLKRTGLGSVAVHWLKTRLQQVGSDTVSSASIAWELSLTRHILGASIAFDSPLCLCL